MRNYKITSARFIVPVEMYSRDVYVSLGESDERFAQGLTRYKDPEFVKSAIKHMAVPLKPGSGRFGLKDGFYILRMGVFPNTSQDYAVMQHEIFHCVETMLTVSGMPHSLKYSSEAYAYFVQYLTGQIYERIW